MKDTGNVRFFHKGGWGAIVAVENAISETLAKSLPLFRVLIIYWGLGWEERGGEERKERGLVFHFILLRQRRRRRRFLLISSSSPGYDSIFFLLASEATQVNGS